MQSNDWNNVNQIFNSTPIKKGIDVDEVDLDQLMSLSIEERCKLLLDELDEYAERKEAREDTEEERRAEEEG